jgi:hypothetical protein
MLRGCDSDSSASARQNETDDLVFGIAADRSPTVADIALVDCLGQAALVLHKARLRLLQVEPTTIGAITRSFRLRQNRFGTIACRKLKSTFDRNIFDSPIALHTQRLFASKPVFEHKPPVRFEIDGASTNTGCGSRMEKQRICLDRALQILASATSSALGASPALAQYGRRPASAPPACARPVNAAGPASSIRPCAFPRRRDPRIRTPWLRSMASRASMGPKYSQMASGLVNQQSRALIKIDM